MKNKARPFEDTINKSIVGETGEVPLYRSYGVKKKVNPLLIAFNVFFARLLASILFILEFAIIAVSGITLWAYGGPLISAVITSILVITFTSINTRVLRRRLGFIIKLNRLCKKHKFRLEHKRSFWRTFTWDNGEDLDFVLKAGHYTYYVKYITPKKPLTSVTFLSKDQIVYTKHPRRSVFTTIFDFKAKTKNMALHFPDYIDEKDKYSIKAILVNPRPRDIFVKTPEGAIVPTGTGEHIYGYTIFTGKGFLETVRRNNEIHTHQ